MIIESRKPIAPGEEITYDHAFIVNERHTRTAKRRYRCICGSQDCRGTMLSRKRQWPVNLQDLKSQNKAGQGLQAD